MRVPTAIGPVRCLRLRAAVFAALLITSAAISQELQFGFSTPTQAELTPPRIDVVSGATAARLEQARALAADKNWDEAVDTYRTLLAHETDRVVALGDEHYVSLATYCQMQLASLPPDALAAYRRQVDPLAEKWYRDGVAGLDEPLLRRVVDQFFCSRWGDDALLALGELALERADYAAARRWWLQISPLLRDPTGQPLWLALRDINVNAHWPAVERRWAQRSQPPQWLAYPDTQLDLADVRARLVLVSVRAGERERAALELDVFRRMHPEAVGRIGGQVGPYVATLERLLTSAGEWPAESPDPSWSTFAGSPMRSFAAPRLGPIMRPAWGEPVKLSRRFRIEQQPAGLMAGVDNLLDDHQQVPVRESQRPLSCFPIVVDGTVVFGDATGIRAVDLATGEPAVTSDGMLYRNESLDELKLEETQFAPSAHGVPRYTLSADHGIVYGRVGRPATAQLESRQTSPGDRLVGLDLSRDGLLAFRARPQDAAWSFDGVPVSDGRRLFVAMRHSEVTPHAYVACYDASTASLLWRTSIAAADTPAAGRGDEITHNLLTLVGDRICFNSNLGIVASLDAADGKICWLHRHDRSNGKPSSMLHFDRDPSPCLYHDGVLVVAPADAPTIFALDADTGQKIWATEELSDALHLLGVVHQNLIISGNRLAAVDLRSGQVRFIWPDSEHAGIRGMGRGVLAGDEVFWPTRYEINVLDAVTGQRTRPPISLRSIGESGANLAVAHGYLIIAGYDKLIALGPSTVPPNQSKTDEDKSAATTNSSLLLSTEP
ncbi:MAG: PQQ-binding-like beta-propeller repeat protein [Pirellulales bacterium]